MSAPEISSPSNRTSPSIRAPVIRSFIRLKQRSSVLLPQPEGPIRAVILLRGMSIVMSLSARDGPYQTERPRVESTIGSLGSRRCGGGGAGLDRRRVGAVQETLIDGLVTDAGVRDRVRADRGHCESPLTDNACTGCESRWRRRSSRARGRRRIRMPPAAMVWYFRSGSLA